MLSATGTAPQILVVVSESVALFTQTYIVMCGGGECSGLSFGSTQFLLGESEHITHHVVFEQSRVLGKSSGISCGIDGSQ